MEVHEPSRESLEKALGFIEARIQKNGKDHNLNTFFMLYYFGPAENIDHNVYIKLPEEARSTNIVRYNLE